jgi:hypothetical protein
MRPSVSATRAAFPSIGTAPRNGVNVTEGVEGGLVGVREGGAVVVGVEVKVRAVGVKVGVEVGGGVAVGVGVTAPSTSTVPFIAVPPGELWS